MGVQAYSQLCEVYQVLCLVVNCFQPSLKLQAKVPQGDRVRRVYDVAQTPLQRLLASGVLSETRQRDLSEQVQQIDPLTLSEHLDVLRHVLWCGVHLPEGRAADERAWPQLRFSLAACPSVLRPPSEEEPERTGHQAPSRAVFTPLETLLPDFGTHRPPPRANWEDPWPSELIQGDPSQSLAMGSHLSEDSQSSVLACPLPAPAPGTPSSTAEEHKASHSARIKVEQAIAAYVQEMRALGHEPKTLQWHQTSLRALQRYLWRQFQFTDYLDQARLTPAWEPAVPEAQDRLLLTDEL